MNNYEIIITACGGAITILLSVIAHISKRYFDEFRKAIMDIGRLEGLITLHKQKNQDDIQNLTNVTELQIQQLTSNVNHMADGIQKLMDLILKAKLSSDE